MKINRVLSILPVLALVLFACSKYPGFKKTSNGLYYKFYTKNKDSIQPKEGDVLTLKLVYRTKDTVLFDSKNNPEPMRLPMKKSDYKGDIFEALALMHVGDSASFIINADSFFIKTAGYPSRPPMIDSNSVLYFDVKLLKVQTKEQLEKETKIKNEQLSKKETEDIAKYVTDNKITVNPTADGLYYMETKAGNGNLPQIGDMVTIHAAIKFLNGTPIFSTYDKGQPVELEYGKKMDNAGSDEAIGMMKQGGKAKLIIPSKLAFGEQGRQGIIPPFSPLLYDIEVVKIRTKAAYEKEMAEKQKQAQIESDKLKSQETVLLDKYLKDNKITTKPTASGLYYIETKKGTGAQASAGKKVKVHYTGKLFNGKKFDSSLDRKQPFEFTLGKGEVIPGWDEAIAKMKVGGKATLIVPSKLAYGERAMGNDIPAYSSLVFDVELLEVK
ncbi:MAG: FKBP-type peptidyl-prolyl cis-trans isomerase [Lentimicrobiaceae bacterium]|nr:FKBP-type peptidyl-prolyl cis-trans isomerase [Lentimicrobiaceae bacterium]